MNEVTIQDEQTLIKKIDQAKQEYAQLDKTMRDLTAYILRLEGALVFVRGKLHGETSVQAVEEATARREFRRGKKRRGEFEPQVGPLVIEEASRDEPSLSELARLLGSLTAARAVLAIQRSDPSRTILECVIEWWLRKEQLQYTVQVPALGGRARAGGTVIDAVVWLDKTHAVAIMGQGNYWHDNPQRAQLDASIKMRLRGQILAGARVVNVVEVWESALYRNVDHVMRMAVCGIEVGK